MQFLLRPLLLPVFLLIPFISSAAGAASTYEGKVISVTDGDTIGVLYKGGRLKVRLAEIDTPEKGQPYGTRARQALSALVFNRVVNVVETDRDRYGRIVGRVHVDGTDVNAEMVRGGNAWVYRKYATDQGLYRLEDEAKAAKRGLWALPEAERVPPWEWRHADRRDATPAMAAPREHAKPRQAGSRNCGAKRTCGEMSSCAEAMSYLAKCGLSRLDSDHDGIPCESICREGLRDPP